LTPKLTVIISGGFSLAYHKVLPAFERDSGVAVTTLSGASQGNGPKTIKHQLEAGADIDVVIMSKEGLGELIALGRIAAGSDAELATVPLGAAVRQGQPKPDLGSVDAFKRAVLAARLVAIPASTSGIFPERRGISDARHRGQGDLQGDGAGHGIDRAARGRRGRSGAWADQRAGRSGRN